MALNLEVIKKLELKRGHKYILILPKSTGLNPNDIQNIKSKFIEMGIVVADSKGIKAIEIKGIDKKTNQV